MCSRGCQHLSDRSHLRGGVSRPAEGTPGGQMASRRVCSLARPTSLGRLDGAELLGCFPGVPPRGGQRCAIRGMQDAPLRCRPRTHSRDVSSKSPSDVIGMLPRDAVNRAKGVRGREGVWVCAHTLDH